MKKFVLSMLCMCTCMYTLAQETTLVVDCQNPGWLSNLITYPQQQSVKNIKVTGYINESDLSFLGSLNRNQQLNGVIDLEDVQIIGATNADNNKINQGYFGGHIQHFILPKTLVSSTACLDRPSVSLDYTTVDTLTIGGEALPSISCGMFYKTIYSADGIRFNKYVKNLILREGVTTIERAAFYNGDRYETSEQDCVFESVIFPSSLVTIKESAFQGCHALRKADLTDNIEEIGQKAFTDTKLYSGNDTIILPSKLKVFYRNSFDCYGNQHIYVPKSVEQIECTNVTLFGAYEKCYLHMASSNPPTLSAEYSSIYQYIVAYVPKNSVEIYKNTQNWQYTTILADLNPATSINIEQVSIEMVKGATKQLNATVYPEDADDKSYTWSSSNNNVATVSQDGLVKAISSGEARIIATLNADKSITDYCTVTVTQPVTEIKLNITSKTVKIGESFNLVATVLPSDADNKNVIWSSEDSNIASVVDGKVTALKTGVTRIYATSEADSHVSAYCTVTVSQPVTEIKLNITSKSVNVGESFNLVATVLPTDADNKNVIWSSDDNSIATVNNGKVTARKSGQTRIYATSEYDSNVYAYCTVTVSQPVTEIKLDITSKTVKVGESFNLVATVYPSDADNKNVVWTSENKDLATVNNGKVTALKPGVVKIYATSESDSRISAYCEVTITQPVTGISLNYSNYTLNFIGDVVQLEATVTPEDATNKEVNWKSSDEAVCIVSNGSVVAVGYGISVIIATTKDGGHMATCTIKVEDNTGIDTVDSAASDAFRVYTLDGKASSLSTKGIKLIKFSNGKTQKVVVK